MNGKHQCARQCASACPEKPIHSIPLVSHSRAIYALHLQCTCASSRLILSLHYYDLRIAAQPQPVLAEKVAYFDRLNLAVSVRLNNLSSSNGLPFFVDSLPTALCAAACVLTTVT